MRSPAIARYGEGDGLTSTELVIMKYDPKEILIIDRNSDLHGV